MSAPVELDATEIETLRAMVGMRIAGIKAEAKKDKLWDTERNERLRDLNDIDRKLLAASVRA